MGRRYSGLPCPMKNELELQGSMGGDANLAKHVAWELQEGSMEGRKGDCTSGSGARPVIPKNGDNELASEEDEVHVSTGYVSILEDTPHAQ